MRKKPAALWGAAGVRFNKAPSPRPSPRGRGDGASSYFCMFGHLQPLVQSSQQGHSHLQFGQSLQQSSVQQVPALQVGSAVVVEDE